MEDKVIVAASGYFDPLHIGHVEYLREAKKLGDKLIVIVNNKKQTLMKKGFEFMPIKERIEIVKAMSFVDEVIESIDEDGSQCKTLEMLMDLERRYNHRVSWLRKAKSWKGNQRQDQESNLEIRKETCLHETFCEHFSRGRRSAIVPSWRNFEYFCV